MKIDNTFSIERTENARYLERKNDTGKKKEKTEQKKKRNSHYNVGKLAPTLASDPFLLYKWNFWMRGYGCSEAF